MTRTFILLLFILCGCATQEQAKEDKTVALEAVQKEEVSLETMANFCAGFYALIGQEWGPAATFFEKALEGDPKSERILSYLVACYIQLNEDDTAMLYMRKLSDINRKDFDIHYTLANLYEGEGRIDEAIIEYERACRSDIEQIDGAVLANALYHLAHLYITTDEPIKAVTCLRDILRLNPPGDVSGLYTEIGMAYIEAGEHEKAREELERSKNLNPYLPVTRLYLAITYDELGELDKAIAEADIFLQESPDAWLAHAFLSGLYAKAANTEDSDLHRDKAIAILQDRVAKDISDTNEHITLAKLLIAKNKKNAAVRIMELAGDKPKSKEEAAEVHFMLASLYYDINRGVQVEQQLREALSIDPDFHEASNFLGYFFAERGEELDEAQQLIEDALKVQPENGAYLDSLGWVYYKQATEYEDDERMDLALEKLIEAVKISPDPEIYKHIGEVYYGLGRWEKAQEQWQTALEEFQEYEDDPNIKWIKEQLKRLETLQMPQYRPHQEGNVVQYVN
ncbi:MAG: tetratricopeptide repeat protein [Candidatus Brocadiales bacterium]